MLFLILLFNVIVLPAIADQQPVVIMTDDDFNLKYSPHDIESIARQYVALNEFFPAIQNRKFHANYAVEGDVWLVFISEPEGEADTSESLDYFYLYIDDKTGRVLGIYYGLLGEYHDVYEDLK